jgi:hypothetical protein
MPVRIYRSHTPAILATVSALACAPASSSSYRDASPVPSMTPSSRVIDAQRIARSGSNTALDAVRAFVPRHRMDAIAGGTAVGSPSTGILRSTGIVLDGHPVAELDALRTIPAPHVVAIHILGASEAISRFGPAYGGGAIVVQTWASLRRG